MRFVNDALLLLALLSWTMPAFAQDAKFTPPRLRITTKSEKNANSPGLQVSAVSPMGLGEKLGLKSGDVIRKITVGEAGNQKEWAIESPNDLSRCLARIRDATLNTKRAVQVSIELRNNQATKTLTGVIIRAEVPDRIDGGTLYHFRAAGKEDPRGGGK